MEIRGIDEVDAAIESGLDQVGDIVVGNAGDGRPHALAMAEGHGPQAHFRNNESRVAELAVTHSHTPSVDGGSMRGDSPRFLAERGIGDSPRFPGRNSYRM